MYACVIQQHGSWMWCVRVCVSAYRNILMQNLSILSIITDQHAYSTSCCVWFCFNPPVSFCWFVYSLHTFIHSGVLFLLKNHHISIVLQFQIVSRKHAVLGIEKRCCANYRDDGETGSCGNRQHTHTHTWTRWIAYAIVTSIFQTQQNEHSVLPHLDFIALILQRIAHINQFLKHTILVHPTNAKWGKIARFGQTHCNRTKWYFTEMFISVYINVHFFRVFRMNRKNVCECVALCMSKHLCVHLSPHSMDTHHTSMHTFVRVFLFFL